MTFNQYLDMKNMMQMQEQISSELTNGQLATSPSDGKQKISSVISQYSPLYQQSALKNNQYEIKSYLKKE